jgi:SHS2 domain-containing protein
MSEPKSGFREVDHTADLELEIWAGTLPGLFEEAARGLNQLLEIRWESDQDDHRIEQFTVEAADNEGLLVSFLGELLYLLEQDRLAGKDFQVEISDSTLTAEVRCGHVRSYSREIKAVTYHRLDIRFNDGVYSVNVVFDI